MSLRDFLGLSVDAIDLLAPVYKEIQSDYCEEPLLS